jgi:hypothetical protein
MQIAQRFSAGIVAVTTAQSRRDDRVPGAESVSGLAELRLEFALSGAGKIFARLRK